jgi:hypothetical protein
MTTITEIKFDINYDAIEQGPHLRKNIAFFKMLKSRKFKDIYRVLGDRPEENKVSIVTLKKGKPLSVPYYMFVRVTGMIPEQFSTEVMELKEVSLKEFNKLVRHEIIENETSEFWSRFERTDRVASIIYLLQEGGTLTLSSVSNIPEAIMRLEGKYFYLSRLSCYKSIGGRCDCEDHNTYNERMIKPSEALGLITDYLIRKCDMHDDDFGMYIQETYIGEGASLRKKRIERESRGLA